MLELLGLAILLIVIGVTGYLLKKDRQPAQRRGRQPVNRYRAVAVRHQLLSCRAVQALDGKRFLASEAPSLPVRGCDIWPCRCRYEHLSDRRVEERRSLYGSRRNLVPHSVTADRRRSDRRRPRQSYA